MSKIPLWLDESISEAQFQRQVLRLAQQLGWLAFHPAKGQYKGGRWVSPTQGDTGFPDLVLCRPPRLVFAELKSAKGRLRPMQQVWRDALQLVPAVEYYTWRPSDWHAILRILE